MTSLMDITVENNFVNPKKSSLITYFSMSTYLDLKNECKLLELNFLCRNFTIYKNI